MQYDAIVVGGSFAGLSAALYIARARRRICVIDAGAPRNRFAAHSHGFFAHDGEEPHAMIAAAREQLAAYPSTSVVATTALEARHAAGGFNVTLSTGETITGGKLMLAHGVTDTLPEIEGLAQRWGKSVLHCPYCHGYEFADRRLGVLYASPMSLHQAALIAEWGPTTLFLNGHAIHDDAAGSLTERAVSFEPAPVVALEG